MALTSAQIAARDGKLTASRVAALMTGDDAGLLRLWQMMVGDPAYVEEDLSGVWPVQLGAATEALNLDWYERKIGPVCRRGEVVVCPDAIWAAATLDGFDEARRRPVECKHVGGFEPREAVIARYQPQLHWQMIVTQTDAIALSIIEGAREPVVVELESDPAYRAELWERALLFMECVHNVTPPVPFAEAAPAVVPAKAYDMTGNNAWAVLAASWLDTRDAARVAATAEKEMKKLVPDDALRAHGHGVEIKRDRAGRLSMKGLN